MFAKLKRAAEGARVPHAKRTANSPTEKMPLPSRIVLPMQQHIGAPCTPAVKKGDTVMVGTVVGKAESFVSADIHSGVSGTVEAIDTVLMSNGVKVQAVVIIPDGQQTPDPACTALEVTDAKSLAQAARDCGLVGLGGAGFPTSVKLSPKNLEEIDTLIINGAECEPYITADNREFLECSDTIMRGVKAVKEHLGIKKVIFGIERNKPEAIDLMFSLTQGDSSYQVKPLESRYPQGAEKVLVQSCTNRVIPLGKLPADVGCLVMNITSVAFLADYLKTGMPLVKKRVTVDGSAIASPKNVIVPIGTKIADVIAFCGGYSQPPAKLLMGGPMMGIALTSDELPILKQNNGILAFAEKDAALPKPTACIRCGRCVSGCPMNLVPTQLEKYAELKDTDKLDQLGILCCMECGTCAYNCPAHRPLVHAIRIGKALLRNGGKK